MKDPYDMSEAEFKEFLENNTSPREVFKNAPRIYHFLEELFKSDCHDSLMREWAFQWWTEKTCQNYSEIYHKWLDSGFINSCLR